MADINTVHILQVKYIVLRVYKIISCIVNSQNVMYKIPTSPPRKHCDSISGGQSYIQKQSSFSAVLSM